MSNAKFQKVVPVLIVRNVTDAVAFYTGKLGFVLRYADSPQNPNLAIVERDNVRMNLQRLETAEFESSERPELRFLVDDVDSLFGEYRTKDVFSSGTALNDTSWGTREFAFADPDGNGLFFYRYLNH